jgi:helix-turn-helix protein
VHQDGDNHLTVTFSYGRRTRIDFSDVANVKALSQEQYGDVTEATVLKTRSNGDVISHYILYVPRSTVFRTSAASLFIMYTEPLDPALPYEVWGPTRTPEQAQYLQEFMDRSGSVFNLITI